MAKERPAQRYRRDAWIFLAFSLLLLIVAATSRADHHGWYWLVALAITQACFASISFNNAARRDRGERAYSPSGAWADLRSPLASERSAAFRFLLLAGFAAVALIAGVIGDIFGV